MHYTLLHCTALHSSHSCLLSRASTYCIKFLVNSVLLCPFPVFCQQCRVQYLYQLSLSAFSFLFLLSIVVIQCKHFRANEINPLSPVPLDTYSELGIGRSRVQIPSAFLCELRCVQPSKPLCASDKYTEDLTLREAVSLFDRSAGVSYQIVHQTYDIRNSVTLRRRKRTEGRREVDAQTGQEWEKEKEGEAGAEKSSPQLLPSTLIFKEILKGNFNSKQSQRWVSACYVPHAVSPFSCRPCHALTLHPLHPSSSSSLTPPPHSSSSIADPLLSYRNLSYPLQAHHLHSSSVLRFSVPSQELCEPPVGHIILSLPRSSGQRPISSTLR